jgi:hypothetical protein
LWPFEAKRFTQNRDRDQQDSKIETHEKVIKDET